MAALGSRTSFSGHDAGRPTARHSSGAVENTTLSRVLQNRSCVSAPYTQVTVVVMPPRGVKGADNIAATPRPARRHEIVEQPVDHGFVERPLIAVAWR